MEKILAVKFFYRAALFSEYICFILPKTFKKDSIVNKLDSNFHLLTDLMLPKNSFIYNGLDYDVPCVFQIWKKESIQRNVILKSLTSNFFEFTNPILADFAIRRVGNLAGKVIIDFKKYESFNEIARNTSGNPSLSKKELIEILEIK